MSLLGSLHIGRNSLLAAQVGIQVTGNNLANANTPGYVRQEAVFQSAPSQQYGNLHLGLGVEIGAVIQRSDQFLEARIRSAASDVSFGEAQENAYLQLETLLSELTDADLSTATTTFFNSIHDVLNEPENVSLRGLAIREGQSLADRVRSLASSVREARESIDDEIKDIVKQVNSIADEIGELNRRLIVAEAGSEVQQANGIRDQRRQKLTELAQLIDVDVAESESGAVSVTTDGSYLVFDNQVRHLTVEFGQGETTGLQVTFDGAPVPLSAGRLGGLLSARDEILGGFAEGLDQYATNFAHEFNRVFSSGQGLTGFTTLTSNQAVGDSSQVADNAGLLFPVENGSFQIQVHNTQTGQTDTHDIFVELNGLEDDTTVDDIVAQINAIDGVDAQLTTLGHVELTASAGHLEFAFANDSSGFLSAVGLNTFFSTGDGTSGVAAELQVSNHLIGDPSKFAASRGGIGNDASNTEILAVLYDTPLASLNEKSLSSEYQDLVGGVVQSASVTRSVVAGFRTFHQALDTQRQSISGVNIDEEAVQMIAHQRAFQASARFITEVNAMLDALINL